MIRAITRKKRNYIAHSVRSPHPDQIHRICMFTARELSRAPHMALV